MVRSKARWYKFGVKNSEYFFNLAKWNHRQKHIKTLKKEDGTSVSNAKQILDEEEQFFKQIFESKNTIPALGWQF